MVSPLINNWAGADVPLILREPLKFLSKKRVCWSKTNPPATLSDFCPAGNPNYLQSNGQAFVFTCLYRLVAPTTLVNRQCSVATSTWRHTCSRENEVSAEGFLGQRLTDGPYKSLKRTFYLICSFHFFFLERSRTVLLYVGVFQIFDLVLWIPAVRTSALSL